MALQGTLKDFALPDILQLIGIQRKTGILTMENDEDTVTVQFVQGNVVGADTSPLDSSSVIASTGTQGSPGNLTTHTITPSSGATELLVDYVDHNNGSETGVTTSGASFLIPYGGQDGAAGGNWTMDSGLALKLTSSATSFVYTRDATAAGAWEAIGAAYKAPAGAAAVQQMLMLLGVGS